MQPQSAKEDPLRRTPGETIRANQALKDYANLGPGRSISKLWVKYIEYAASGGNPPSKNQTVMLRWSTTHSWLARVGDWQELQQKDATVRMAERFEAMQKRVLTLGEALMKKAEEMIAWNLEKEEQTITADGKTTIIRKYPAKWDFSTPSQFVKVVHELFSLINGRPTQHLKIDDIESMTDDELRKHLAERFQRRIEASSATLEGSGTPTHGSTGDSSANPETGTVH